MVEVSVCWGGGSSCMRMHGITVEVSMRGE